MKKINRLFIYTFFLKSKKIHHFFCLSSILLGLTKYLSFQDGIYNAQIISKIIPYKTNDIMFQWGSSLWSIIVQFSGLLLRIGLNEIILSCLLSVLIIYISLNALYTLGKTLKLKHEDALLLSYSCIFCKFYLWGFGYEVSFVSWELFNSTLGQVGFLFSLFSISLLLSPNSKKPMSFVVPFAFCIHPFFALFPFLLFTTLIFLKKINIDYKMFMLGSLLTVTSFLIHIYLKPNPINEVLSVNIDLSNFIRNWDEHRGISLFNKPSRIFFILLGLCLASFSRLKNIKYTCLYILSIALFIILFILIKTNLYFQFNFIAMIMPEKLLNFGYFIGGFMYLAFAFKIIPTWLNAITLSVFFVLDTYYSFSVWNNYLFLIFIIIFLLILGIHFLPSQFKTLRHETLIPFLIIIPIHLHSVINNRWEVIHNELKLANKVSFNDYIVVSPLHKGSYVQFLSRSKILFDPTELSDIPYSLSSAQKSFEIMKNIYNVDITEDSYLNIKDNHWITHIKNTWQNRQVNDWLKLSQKYNFSYLLVPPDWDIDYLKVEYKNSQYKLLKIR